MTAYIRDYLWGIDIDGIDRRQLVEDCYGAEQYLKSILPSIVGTGSYSTFTTAHFLRYNLLTFPSVELVQLYKMIRQTTTPYLHDDSYMIQCWLNVYRKGENIKWHKHWPEGLGVYHGFYCVQTEEVPSHTLYRVPGYEEVMVDSRDGLLVFGKSEGDTHMSSVWEGVEPRITIAFDIIPTKHCRKDFTLNRIPF